MQASNVEIDGFEQKKGIVLGLNLVSRSWGRTRAGSRSTFIQSETELHEDVGLGFIIHKYSERIAGTSTCIWHHQ